MFSLKSRGKKVLKIRVSAEIRHTESPEKVKRALKNVFIPVSLVVRTHSNGLILVTESNKPYSLKKLHYLLRKQLILDSAREYLKRGIAGTKITFYLHKQAAYAGIVSFCSVPEKESPLGPIKFEIYCKSEEDIEKLLNWLAPRTIRGRPVNEQKSPPDP